jgi:hypothetical protein
MSRRSISAIVVAAVGLSLLVLWLRQEPSQAFDSAAARSAAEVAPDSAAHEASGDGRALAQIESSDEQPEEKRDGAISEATTSAAPTLRGRVVLEELDGSERHDSSGSFHLFFDVGELGEWEKVSFEHGQWQLSRPLPAELPKVSVHAATSEGRSRIIVEPAERFDLAPSEELLLRLRVAPESTLRVLDASSGADLRDVEIVLMADQRGDEPSHPGLDFAARRVASGLSSPIALGEFSPKLFRNHRGWFHVGAQGYGWILAEVEWQQGGETRVALQRGTTLAVNLSGVHAEAGTLLRISLSRSRHPWFESAVRSDGVVEIEGIPEGGAYVTAEIGEWYAMSRTLASASAELRRGVRNEVTLVLDDPPDDHRAAVGGWIHVAREWGARRLDLRLEFQGVPLGGRPADLRLTSTHEVGAREGFDSFRWLAEDVQVGEHKLWVTSPFAVETLQVPREGKLDFELVFGAPAELSLRFVDVATGAPVAVKSVHWHPAPQGPSYSGSIYPAPFIASRGVHVIRSRRERVAISVMSEGYLPHEGTIDLSSGDREQVVRLERATSLYVSLHSEGATLPIPDSWSDDPDPVAGEGYTRVSMPVGAARLFQVSEPGTYELNPPVLDGFVPLPRQRVELIAGQRTVLALEYERVR